MDKVLLKELGDLKMAIDSRTSDLKLKVKRGDTFTSDEWNFLSIKLNSLFLEYIAVQLKEISEKLDKK